MSMAERAKATQVVSGRLADWARTFSNRDLDSLGRYYDQGRDLSVAWPDGHRTFGWREESAAERAFLAGASQLNFAIRDVTVDVIAQTVAVATFSASLDRAVGARRTLCIGPGTSVWVLEEGPDWRIRTLQTACANSQ